MKRVRVESSDSCSASDEIEVPEGWQNLCLSDVADLISGAGFPEILQGQQNLQYPFFKVGNLGEVESGHPLLTSKHTVDERIVKELHAKIIPPDSIVFAKIGMAIALNRRRMIGVASCIDNNMMAAVPNEKILPRYLLRFLETAEFMPFTQATTVPSLRKSDLAQIQIPLPPLSEQEHIVARVEVLLTNVNAARDRLRRVPLIMKKFRQAVLAAACSGRLTEEWRIGKDLRDWEDKTLQSISSNKKNAISSGPFGSALGLKDYHDNGIPVIRSQNIQQGKFTPNNFVYVSELKATELKRSEVIPGDIVIVAVGASSGNVAMVTDEFPRYILSQNCNKFSFNSEIVNLKFVFLALQTDFLIDEMRSITTDTARPFLSLTNLKTISISFPPLDEQNEIVRRVGLLFERADAFDQEVAAAGWRCERLTLAVLGKAFRGELTTHESKAN